MVHEKIDDTKDGYYLFFIDLNFEEVDIETFYKMEKEWNGREIYFKVQKYNIGSTKSFYNGYFAHSDYRFYDYRNQNIMVKEGGFTLWSINEKKDRSREVIYQVLDGKYRNRKLLNTELDTNWTVFFQIEGIKNILLFLRDLGNIEGFEVYDMKQEIKKLKKLNKDLTIKLSGEYDPF